MADYSLTTPQSNFGSPNYASIGGYMTPVIDPIAPANYGFSNLTNSPMLSLQGNVANANSLYTPNLGGNNNTPASGGMLDWLRTNGVIGQRDQKTGQMSDSWGGLALGAAQGIGSLYLGMQQYNLAKDALANSKFNAERNFQAQKSTTNAQLEDRQRARVASNSGAYQSVGDYMNQNGVR